MVRNHPRKYSCGVLGSPTRNHAIRHGRPFKRDSRPEHGQVRVRLYSLTADYDATQTRYVGPNMTNGDVYPMLNRAGGGYTYQYVSRDGNGDVLEDRNEMLAHIKKYIIGKGADCDGNVGINQDAANNIYLMRLADVYLTYVEAKMGTASSTSDATAMKYYNMVRQRAGVAEASSVTYMELLKERRRELAFESQTWFDTSVIATVRVMPPLSRCSTTATAQG